MKEIMAAESKEGSEVASFEFNPAKKELVTSSPQMDLNDDLFGPKLVSDPIADLAEELRSVFAGKTMREGKVYQEHHEGRPFISANYRNALLQLEEHGKIICTPPAKDRVHRNGKPTLAEDVIIEFPQKQSEK